MRARGALIVTLLAFAVATSAFPQTQEQIPKELALALMPSGAAEGGEIIVGQMPMDLTALLTLPAGARVLGSFVSTSYAQAVLTLPLRTDSALSVVRKSLLEHGLKSSSNEAERLSKTWSKAIGTRGTQEITITVTKMASQNGCYDISLRASGLPR